MAHFAKFTLALALTFGGVASAAAQIKAPPSQSQKAPPKFSETLTAQTLNSDTQGLTREIELSIECLQQEKLKIRQSLKLIAKLAETSHDKGDLEALKQRVERIQRDTQACLEDVRLKEPKVLGALPDFERPTVDVLDKQESNAQAVIQQDAALAAGLRVAVAERLEGPGEVDENKVRGAVAAQAGKLRSCYQRAQKSPDGASAGQATLFFTIKPSGKVRKVRVQGVTVPDADFESCIERAARSIRLERGAASDWVTYRYSLDFAP